MAFSWEPALPLQSPAGSGTQAVLGGLECTGAGKEGTTVGAEGGNCLLQNPPGLSEWSPSF